MKVLTQNISWEAMSGTNTPTVRGSSCLSNSKNVCAENVIQILNRGYDIICVQENVFDFQIEELSQADATQGRETISILYKNEQTLLHKYSGELDARESGRPWLMCIFDSLVVVCVHAGHRGNGQFVFETIERSLSPEDQRMAQMRPIVVAGDFNMNMPSSVNFLGKTLTKSPSLITCCDSQLGTDQNASQDPELKGPRRQADPSQYRQSTAIDHIFISPTLNFENVQVVPTITTNRLASDHLALEAVVR